MYDYRTTSKWNKFLPSVPAVKLMIGTFGKDKYRGNKRGVGGWGRGRRNVLGLA